MISQRVSTQAEVDAALLNVGIKPTGKYTSDRSQQLYENADGKGFMLPSDNQGYSWYAIEDILAHVKKMSLCSDILETRNFVAKPDLKLV